MSSFGENLRRQRELRGMSLDAISTTTKISPRMLRALEDERFDQLPGGVFNKGFVRAYARQIGINEEDAITQYLAALRQSQVQVQSILPDFRAPAGKPVPASNAGDNGGPIPNRDMDSHLIDRLVNDRLVNDRLVNDRPVDDRHVEKRATEDRRKEARRSQDRMSEGRVREDRTREDGALVDRTKDRFRDDRLNNHQAEFSGSSTDESLDEEASYAPLSFLNLESVPQSIPEPVHSERFIARTPKLAPISFPNVPWRKVAVPLLVVLLGLIFWTFHRRAQSVQSSQAIAVTPPMAAPSTPSISSAPTQLSQPSKARAVASGADPTASARPAAAEPDVIVRKFNLHPQAAMKRIPAPFTLHIRAAQTSWISIVADGQAVARETLIAPANTSVRATREITVKAGNSAGISFLMNNKKIPVQGSPNEVRTYTFDASGLTASPASTP